MQIATQPLEVDDFSGGITDNYMPGSLRHAKILDNFFILPNKKIKSRWGSELDDDTNAQIPAGTQRIGTLINYNNSSKLLVQSAKNIYYRNPSAYATLVGPVTSNPVFNEGTTASYVSYSEWNRHLFLTNDAFPLVSKIYSDGSGTLQVRTAGLPALASSPTVTAGAPGAESYIYAFVHYFTYTIGTEVFEDFGPVTQVALSSATAPDSSTVAISNIPALANGVTTNYATTAIKIKIYRTLTGGTSFFYIGEVTNGTTTYNDSAADATIESNAPLYTEGGVVENDPPPLCKFVHVVNNIGYYAHIKEGSEVRPNTYKISLANDPDSVPGSFEDTVEDEIAGVNSVESIPIVLCKRHIYRSEGSFDEQGRGFLGHTRISDTAGCVSNLSAVQAEGGLYWAGNDGFYYTDGYRVIKISDHLNITYANYIASMTSPKRIVGTFDEKYRRIFWTVQADSSSSDNDLCVVLELRWGISSEMVFSTVSGGTSFNPTAVVVFNRELYRADYRGLVFRHDEDLDTDVRIDLTVAATTWVEKTILYNYTSCATNFGTTLRRKWVPNCVITAANRGSVSVQPTALNDDGARIRPLREIRHRDLQWGDEDFSWGNTDCYWGTLGILEQRRRMPAGGLRVSYLQLELTNSYTVITNSDTLGTASVDTTAKTATLDNPSTADWPASSVDYYLHFEHDSYVEAYLVTGWAADVLTFLDINGTAPTGSKKWLLKGYRKNETLELLSYAFIAGAVSDSAKIFQSSDVGDNAS